jgi:hypothetical protein
MEPGLAEGQLVALSLSSFRSGDVCLTLFHTLFGSAPNIPHPS